MADVVMPRLSDSMEEGTILKWLKSVGDEVAVGDELVEIETDKANMVYEADTPGRWSRSSPRRATRCRSASRSRGLGMPAEAASGDDGGAGGRRVSGRGRRRRQGKG